MLKLFVFMSIWAWAGPGEGSVTDFKMEYHRKGRVLSDPLLLAFDLDVGSVVQESLRLKDIDPVDRVKFSFLSQDGKELDTYLTTRCSFDSPMYTSSLGSGTSGLKGGFRLKKKRTHGCPLASVIRASIRKNTDIRRIRVSVGGKTLLVEDFLTAQWRWFEQTKSPGGPFESPISALNAKDYRRALMILDSVISKISNMSGSKPPIGTINNLMSMRSRIEQISKPE